MSKVAIITCGLLAFCSIASAQNALITGHVQRVVLLPDGAETCPPVCPTPAPIGRNGVQTVCITNQGGCQIMEVKVDHDYRGASQGQIKEFRSRIGEWGPSFPVTNKQILVMEHAGHASWFPITEVDGKSFIDPKSIPTVHGVRTSPESDKELVALEEFISRAGAAR